MRLFNTANLLSIPASTPEQICEALTARLRFGGHIVPHPKKPMSHVRVTYGYFPGSFYHDVPATLAGIEKGIRKTKAAAATRAMAAYALAA